MKKLKNMSQIEQERIFHSYGVNLVHLSYDGEYHVIATGSSREMPDELVKILDEEKPKDEHGWWSRLCYKCDNINNPLCQDCEKDTKK